MKEESRIRRLLDDLLHKQKEVIQCHDYYTALEKEIEKKKERMANPQDYEELEQVIAQLNGEYESKSNFLMEELHALLIEGERLFKKMGHEPFHHFKKLWNYLTQPMGREVEMERVKREIETLKGACNIP